MVARRPVEPGVAEGEDAAVGRHQPVAAAVGGGRHAHHRLVEPDVPRRPVEAGVAEGEDAAVGGHQPVALGRGRRRHAHDRLVERPAPHGAVEPHLPEREDAAVGRHRPVAPGPEVGEGHAAVEAEGVVARLHDHLGVSQPPVGDAGVMTVTDDDVTDSIAPALPLPKSTSVTPRQVRPRHRHRRAPRGGARGRPRSPSPPDRCRRAVHASRLTSALAIGRAEARWPGRSPAWPGSTGPTGRAGGCWAPSRRAGCCPAVTSLKAGLARALRLVERRVHEAHRATTGPGRPGPPGRPTAARPCSSPRSWPSPPRRSEQKMARPVRGSASAATSGTSRHDTVPAPELSGHGWAPVKVSCALVYGALDTGAALPRRHGPHRRDPAPGRAAEQTRVPHRLARRRARGR